MTPPAAVTQEVSLEEQIEYMSDPETPMDAAVHESLIRLREIEGKLMVPDEEENFRNLVCAVEKIDPVAAEYLRVDARKLGNFSIGGKLNGIFTWEESPQGHEYWEKIHDALLLRGKL